MQREEQQAAEGASSVVLVELTATEEGSRGALAVRLPSYSFSP